MYIIDSTSALGRFLDGPVDEKLKRLLRRRGHQLVDPDHPDIAPFARFLVVEPDDERFAVETWLGSTIASAADDDSHSEDASFDAAWEWIADHGGWFELVFVLTDDGYAHVVFVADQDGVDRRLLDLCRAHSVRFPDAANSNVDTNVTGPEST